MIIRCMIYECEPNCVYCKELNKPRVDFFYAHIYKNSATGCWDWTAYIDPAGYGKMYYLGNTIYAHRFSLSLATELVDGFEIDHLCRNRKCVNPEHLEQVTHRENVLRSPINPFNNPKVRTYRRTQCKRGHAVSGRCEVCRKLNRKKYEDKNREKIRLYQLEYQSKKRELAQLANV